MAIIRSGVLVGLSRSAAGLTFYNRKGVQVVRAKPQFSQSYVPSDRQLFYKQMFSYVNDFAKSSSVLMRVIAGGWDWSRRHNGSTNLNNFIGYIIRLMSRSEGGQKRDFDAVRSELDQFLANPYFYWTNQGALTATNWPIVYNFRIYYDGDLHLVLDVPFAAMQAWRDAVAARSGRYRNVNPVFVALIKQNAEGTETTPIQFLPMVETSIGYQVSITDADITTSNWQMALALSADPNVLPGDASSLALSPILGRSQSYEPIPDVSSMVVDNLVVGGVTYPADAAPRISFNQIYYINGSNLYPDQIRMLQREGANLQSLTNHAVILNRSNNQLECRARGPYSILTLNTDDRVLIDFRPANP